MTDFSKTPAGMIARLDESLRRAGEDATLRRPIGTQQLANDVGVRIRLRGCRSDQLVGQTTQQEQEFILSPTQINRAQWPGATVVLAGPQPDPRVPRHNDILLTSRGRLTVQEAAGLYVQGVLVRIDGRAKGQ